MNVEVKLIGRSSAFLADEVEYMPGWLRAVGRFPHWDIDDETGEEIISYSERREHTWPERRIKEVVPVG